MLAAPSSSPHQYNPFRPIHSSPLARDARRATFNFAMNNSTTPTSNTNSFSFGQQPNDHTTATQPRQNIKQAPKLNAERLGTQRRGAFLRKVREGREERRWETRGEDIMRADFLSRQRAWEAAQARNAPIEDVVYYDEDENEEDVQIPANVMEVSTSQAVPEDEVDEFLRDEDQELEALLEFMPAPGPQEGEMRDDGDSLWSDDVDYEALFEQVLSQEEEEPRFGSLNTRMRGSGGGVEERGDEMDMS